jgi:Bacterial toxin homologue of phage lysozyme, C-term
MAVDWKFIGTLEGAGILKGYVPVSQTSNSGVTIATGVDLGQGQPLKSMVGASTTA